MFEIYVYAQLSQFGQGRGENLKKFRSLPSAQVTKLFQILNDGIGHNLEVLNDFWG